MSHRNLLAAYLLGATFLPSALYAQDLPSNPTVVAGDVTVTTPSPTQLLMQQGSQYGIVDWGSFSIGQGFGVQVNNGSGTTLNRVTGGDLSSIMGSLTATGSVYLINPNGIVVGKTGVINTGGRFVATTLDMSDSDLLNGGDATFAGESAAYVVNLGQVSSMGGDVALLARHVVNEGTITAPNGTVGLVAGREILMRDAAVDDGLFAVKIGGDDTSVSDSGAIRAAAAELRANGGNVYALAGNTKGTIEATGVAKVKGKIFLTAGDTGKLKVDKPVKAKNLDGSGGTITAHGKVVDLSGLIDASGTQGGTVLVTATGTTTFDGQIFAKGGEGGFVEVSGEDLSFTGAVDTEGGTLLIDPRNLEVTDNNSVILSGASAITTSSLISALSTQNVIVQTNGAAAEAGTILVSSELNYSSDFDLTFLARGDVIFFASVQNAQGDGVIGGDVNVVAGWNGLTSTTTFNPTPFLNADLATTTLFGQANGTAYTVTGATGSATVNASGSFLITPQARGFNHVAVGSMTGATRLFASGGAIGGGSGYSQLGFNVTNMIPGETASGDIVLRSTGVVNLLAGSSNDDGAQIGHIGMNFGDVGSGSTVSASGAITVEAQDGIELSGSSASGAFNQYAMIGHGSLDRFGVTQSLGDRSGAITVISHGDLSLQPGALGSNVEAWIGHATASGTISGADVAITAFNFDQDVSVFPGPGSAGTLDVAMLAADTEGGNVTVTQTDTSAGASLLLTGTTATSSCECGSVTTAGTLTVQTGGNLQLDSGFAYSNLGGGDLILASGGNLQNDAGAAAIGTMKGRWLLFSNRPDADTGTLGVLSPNFIQYGTSFDPLALPGSGNGLIYRVTPVVTVGSVTQTYGDAFVAPAITVQVDGADVSAAAFGFSVDPATMDGSVVTFSNGLANAGTYVGGLITSVNSLPGPTGAAGPTLTGVTVNKGDLQVDRATLTVLLADETKDYDGIGLYTGDVTFSGFQGEDTAALITAGPTFAFTGGDGSGINAATYTVSASGTTESSGNYTILQTDTASLVINPLQLGIALGGISKIYDGTDVATLQASDFVLSGFLSGQGATVTKTTGTYGTANATDATSVTVALAAGDYAATGTTLLSNYVLPTLATGTGAISRRDLSAAVIGTPTKSYDGSDLATLLASNYQLTGFVAGEGATVTKTTGTYASPNASDTNPVTVTLAAGDFAATGATLLSNYVLPTVATGNGVISRLALSAAVIGTPTKAYDGTDLATLLASNFQLTGFIEGEGATVTKTTGTYASQNASDTSPITVALAAGDFAATGATLLSNYVLPTEATGNGVISRLALSAAVIGTPTKAYDGTDLATLLASNYQLTGFIEGEGATVTKTTGTYASPNASDTNPVTVTLVAGDFAATGATLLSNYVLPTEATGNGAITRLALSAAVIGTPTKAYDGTDLATLLASNYQLTGFITGEGATVTKTTGTYASANASDTNPVTVTLAAGDFAATGATLLSNYVLPTEATGNGAITRLALSAAVIGTPTKAYDGTDLATLLASNFQLTGFITGEGATVTKTMGTYASPNASDTNPVTVALAAGDFAATGATLLSNYVLPTEATGNGAITRLALGAAVIGTPTKAYDGTDLATLLASNYQLTGFIDGEGATVTKTTGTYASPNASDTNPVTVVLAAGDFAATGATLLSNYVLPIEATGNGAITRLALGAAIIGTPTKAYDGTDLATLLASNYQLTGFIDGEGATVTKTTGTYASPNASDTNPITVALAAGDFAATGATLLSNYVLPTEATGNGAITRLALGAAIVGTPTKAYDGTDLATLLASNYQLTGFIDGEGATVTKTTGTYASQNASDANPVTVTLAAGDFAVTGATTLSNYVLPTTATGAGAITRLALSAAIVGNPTKPFDGTTNAVLTSANFLLNGFIAGEGAQVLQTTGSYDAADTGTRQVTATLAPADFEATGATNLSNYILPTTASGLGTIGASPTLPPPTPTLTRSIDTFPTTPLGEPTGPSDVLQTINTETTQAILDEINAGASFCREFVQKEYAIDCLSDRLQAVADGLSSTGEYSEVRAALEDAARQLHALALANASSVLDQRIARSVSGPVRSSSRPLTAISEDRLAAANAQASAIIVSTQLVLLRSAANSERRRVAFTQVGQVLGSTKVLLRSS